ncbi:MAG: DUF4124 domain-containing protein [Candidatus Dactylopiibacterium sp.]|nr:DUF4124 domain-containing protein [Candidatus Dactylopiibacterium sp.]
MNSRMLVALAACLLPVVAVAQIYTWKDANGRTHFGDQPPPAANARTMRGGVAVEPPAPQATASAPQAAGSAPQAAASGPKSWQERDKEFLQRQNEKAEADAKAKKESQARAEKARHCAELQNTIALLERGGRVAKANEKGESVPMSDTQMLDELQRARQRQARDCR